MEWAFLDEPSLDEDAQEVLGEEGMPRGPVVFWEGKVGKAL